MTDRARDLFTVGLRDPAGIARKTLNTRRCALSTDDIGINQRESPFAIETPKLPIDTLLV